MRAHEIYIAAPSKGRMVWARTTINSMKTMKLDDLFAFVPWNYGLAKSKKERKKLVETSTASTTGWNKHENWCEMYVRCFWFDISLLSYIYFSFVGFGIFVETQCVRLLGNRARVTYSCMINRFGFVGKIIYVRINRNLDRSKSTQSEAHAPPTPAKQTKTLRL